MKKFPIDNLKVDKHFVDDYATEDGAVFLKTIVQMGQTLNMSVIAEGVEDQKQLSYLQSIGCATYQGYWYSKPLPVKEFEALYFEKEKRVPAYSI